MDVLLGATTGGVGGGSAGLEPGMGGTRLDRCADVFRCFGDVGDVSAVDTLEWRDWLSVSTMGACRVLSGNDGAGLVEEVVCDL